MTSKFTREENVQAVFDLKAGYTLGLADVEILKRVARMALAALDSEPMAEVLSNRPGNDTSTIDRALPVGTKLYLHAQPAPVVPTFEEWCKRTDQKPQGWVRDAMKEAYDGAAVAMLQAGNSPVIPGCDGAELLPSTGVVIKLSQANNEAMLAAAPQEAK